MCIFDSIYLTSVCKIEYTCVYSILHTYIIHPNIEYEKTQIRYYIAPCHVESIIRRKYPNLCDFRVCIFDYTYVHALCKIEYTCRFSNIWIFDSSCDRSLWEPARQKYCGDNPDAFACALACFYDKTNVDVFGSLACAPFICIPTFMNKDC